MSLNRTLFVSSFDSTAVTTKHTNRNTPFRLPFIRLRNELIWSVILGLLCLAMPLAAQQDGETILYHSPGRILPGPHNIYIVWYGNWSGNSALTLLPNFIMGLNGSSYFNINTVYTDSAGEVVNNVVNVSGSTFDNYSHGTSLTTAQVADVVNQALLHGNLPYDANGIYFVLTSSDVTQSPGPNNKGAFCQQSSNGYCGWHLSGSFEGRSGILAFVGNPDQCPNVCFTQQGRSPNGNVGADEMASVIAHELAEAVTDPQNVSWYDGSGEEIGDKCLGTFGSSLFTTPNGALANVVFNGTSYFIQQLWTNENGCTSSFQRPLASWFQSDGPHFVYVTGNQEGTAPHLQQVWYNLAGNAWFTQDLTATTGSSSLMPGGTLGIYGTGGAVVYQSLNGDIYQNWWSGSSWISNDLTAATGTSVVPGVGTAINSWVDSAGIHAVYVDTHSHINQIFYNGSTTINQDLTGSSGAPLAAPNTGLTSWVQSDGSHFLYLTTNGHLQQIINTTGTQDLTAVLGLPATASSIGFTSWVGADGPFFVYITNNQHLQQVSYSVSHNLWQSQDITTSSGAPVAAGGSSLTNWIQSDGSSHVVYINSSQHLQQIVNTTGTQDLSAMLSLPTLAPATGLTSWNQSDGPHFVYINSSMHLQQVWFNVSAFAWFTQDLTAITGGPNAN